MIGDKEKPKQDKASQDRGTIHSNTARIANKNAPDKKTPNDYKYIQRSKKDLQQKAKHVGIKGYQSMSKDELIEALEKA